MGRLIGRADADDVRAAFYRQCEALIARDLHERCCGERDDLNEQVEKLRMHALSIPVEGDERWTPVSDELREAVLKVHGELVVEYQRAQGWADRCEQVLKDMAAELGKPPNHLNVGDSDQDPSPLAALGHLERELDALEVRWDRIEDDCETVVEHLRLTLARKSSFARTPDSLSLDRMDALHHGDFELLIARVLERDGFTIERRHGGPGDRGVDVIGAAPNYGRVGFQAKHSRTGKAVVERDVHCMNGTARHSHGVDVAVMVTNAGFTKGPQRFAAEAGIHLIDRSALRRWITWGDHLDQVISLAGDRRAT